MVAGKTKTFYVKTRILGPIFIVGPILILGPIFIPSLILIPTLSIISTPTNTLALHYGLIQPDSKVIATKSNSMVKLVVLFRLQLDELLGSLHAS